MMNIGIVGSRRRYSLKDRRIVQKIVRDAKSLYGEITIVSGGCPTGADRFAEEAADLYGVKKWIFPVSREPPIISKYDFRERAFARNRLIAENSDILIALCHIDRKGGTENTVSHMRDLGKTCLIVDEEGMISLEV